MADLTGPLGLPAALWEVMACPCPQHSPVAADEQAGKVVCTRCRTRFDVRDKIPVMLLDEAAPGPGGVGADLGPEA